MTPTPASTSTQAQAQAPAQGAGRASRAVLFGVHAYQHLGDLDGVRHNVPALRALLTAVDVGGLDEAHCVTVPADSTSGILLDAVQDAADEAEDLLLVYYSGHGHYGRDGRSLLLATRASHAQRHHHSVPYDEVRAIVGRSRARHKIVIVDCCFSGLALHMSDGPTPAAAPDFEIEGACVLTSAAETEPSLCLPTGSVFTLELAGLLGEGLSGPLPDGRRGEHQATLTMADVYQALRSRLTDRTVEGLPVPRPRMSTRDNGHLISLAGNRAFTEERLGPRAQRSPHTAYAPTRHFTGREEELAELERLAARPPAVCLVHGRGGQGKSELLRAAAARMAHLFPGGCLEIDLRGWTPGEQRRDPYAVIAEQLRHLGHRAEDIPADLTARAETWRLFLESRSVLLLLDDARDSAQLLPLLPGAASRSMVLISSRSELPDLPKDWRHELGPLPTADCIAVWHKMGVPDGTRHLGELADRIKGSPHALRSLSTRLLRGASPEAVLASLSEPARYRAFRDIDAAERAAFTSAYDTLDEDLRALIRHAAWHPGPDFGSDSLAAMAELPEHEAEVRLTEIEQLLTWRDGRYSLHDLSLVYARERAAQDDPEGQGPSRARLYAHLHQGLGRSSAVTGADPDSDDHTVEEALRWLAAHTRELGAAARTVRADGWDEASDFLDAVANWFYLDDRYTEAVELYQLLLDAAVPGSLGHADALAALANVYRLQNRNDEARTRYQQAHELYEELGMRRGQADTLDGLARVHMVQYRYEDATTALLKAHDIYVEEGGRRGQADSLDGLGDIYRLQDRYDEAAVAHRKAYELYEVEGDRRGQADALKGLAAVHHLQADDTAAAESYERALGLYTVLGDRRGQAESLIGLAWVNSVQGLHEKADAAYRKAQGIFEALGDPAGQAHTLYGLARSCRIHERYDEALAQYREACDIFRELGDRLNQAIALHGMGKTHLTRREYDEAATAFTQSRVLHEGIQHPRLRADVLKSLAAAHMFRERHDDAFDALQEANALYEASGDSLGQADSLLSLADVAWDLGRHGRAADAFRTAARLYDEIGLPEEAEACRTELAACEAEAEEKAEAEAEEAR